MAGKKKGTRQGIQNYEDVANWEKRVQKVVENGVGDETCYGVIVAAYIVLGQMLTIGHTLGYAFVKPNTDGHLHNAHQDSGEWFSNVSGAGGFEGQSKFISSLFLKGDVGTSTFSISTSKSLNSNIIHTHQKKNGSIMAMDPYAGGVKGTGSEFYHGAGSSDDHHLTVVSVAGDKFEDDDWQMYGKAFESVTRALREKGYLRNASPYQGPIHFPEHTASFQKLPHYVEASIRGTAGGKTCFL